MAEQPALQDALRQTEKLALLSVKILLCDLIILATLLLSLPPINGDNDGIIVIAIAENAILKPAGLYRYWQMPALFESVARLGAAALVDNEFAPR